MLTSSSMFPSSISVRNSIVMSSPSPSHTEKGPVFSVDPFIMLIPNIAGLSESRLGFSLAFRVPCCDHGTPGFEMLLCLDGVDCGVAFFDDGFEGVWLKIFDVLGLRAGLGGVFWGVVDMCCNFTLAFGLGEVSLMEGEVYVDRCDGDFPGEVTLLLGGVMDVILDLTTMGSSLMAWDTVDFGDM